jgi:hypothetical protein
MYNSSVDALTQLLVNSDGTTRHLEGSKVAAVSSMIRTLRNGINHCCVEIKLENGVEYRIEAFGKEAEELHRTATQYPA